jgi:hypothetical protein
MNTKLIAPCGMNCNLCMAYLRDKNRCPGCRASDKDKAISCRRCIIKNCEILRQNKLRFCSPKCKNYPCARLKSLDKRYRTKYAMSMIENLEFIDKKGIRKFLKNEEKRWVKDNRVFCVHKKEYY